EFDDFDTCKNAKIDGILSVNNKIFIFNEHYFWSLNIVESTLNERNFVNDFFPNVFTPIDSVASFQINLSTFIILIKEDIFWIYKSVGFDSLNATFKTMGHIEFDDDSDFHYRIKNFWLNSSYIIESHLIGALSVNKVAFLVEMDSENFTLKIKEWNTDNPAISEFSASIFSDYNEIEVLKTGEIICVNETHLNYAKKTVSFQTSS
ncbi:hypothetical protein B4U79_19146, partial [Dinothrombium tinctorium]